MAEQEAKTTEEEGGGKKKLIIIIAAALVVLLGAGAAAYFLFLKKDPLPEEDANEQVEMIQPEVDDAEIGPMINIEEFIVNIISEDTAHYVKASLTLELTNEKVLEEATKRMPQIRDAVLLLIGNKTFEELQDLQGKKQVKAELKNRINTFLKTGKVKSIYMTDFVVQ
ncbi:flagellar basal body-associated FliL family protein [Desulfogranum marinum]|uniref:flagellar basal body-associated FliL family protein n=1 Tax=Desulfogranum marinum TaxID=453220 RepID=UPI0019651264|nr:flagellar basal body-associated FliL family protein [Desulfogranum marinum]MBM9513181.1 flagellar basal body-associated FliL family protein [Desulfogranum marinum]